MTTLFEALEDALAAPNPERRIFCGLTANVEYVLPFAGDEFLKAQDEFGARPGPPGGARPSPVIASVQNALEYAAWFMVRGTGGEGDMPSCDPVMPLVDSRPHSNTIGGTGIQAANWLAHAGYAGTVVHIPYHAPAFDGLFHKDLRFIDNNRGYADLMAGVPFSEVHCIVDYARGTRVRTTEGIVEAPRHDRVILSADRCNSRLRVSPGFRAAARLPCPDSSLLVTGSSSPRELGDFHRFVDDCVALIRDYRQANPRGFIHIEDCYQWLDAAERRRTIAERIWPIVDSVGMNEAEYLDLAEFFGLDASDSYASLLRLASRHGLKRVCLHTATHCRAVTKYPPEAERRAMALAIVFSSARAYFGGFVERPGLLRLLEETRGISEKLVLPEAGGAQGYAFIELPTLYGMPVRSSIGLGDAFTAGLMAYL